MKTQLLIFLIILSFITGYTQSDNENLGKNSYLLLDRVDLKLKNDSILNFESVKPLNRKILTERIESLTTNKNISKLSQVDKYNISHFLSENSEWTSTFKSIENNKPFLKHFYKTPSHFYAVNTNEFTLRVEPVLYLQIGHSNDGSGINYQNTRGILLRGNIHKAIGFYSYLTDNQEKDPSFVQDWVVNHTYGSRIRRFLA